MKQKRNNWYFRSLNAIAIYTLLIGGVSNISGTRVAAAFENDTQPSELTSGQRGISFEENRGQVDSKAKFISRNGGQTVFFTSDAAWFVLPMSVNESRESGIESQGLKDDGTADNQRMYAVRMQIEGANSQARVAGEDELPGHVNYFRGNDPAKWQTDVKTFGAVRYEKIYEGIDLIYYGSAKSEMEYDFRVAAGADAGQILLKFDGAEAVELNAAGDLVIKTPAGDLLQRKPFVYQESGGGRAEVPSSYLVEADGRVRFNLGEYDASRPLVIDPVLGYSSYLGGTNTDVGGGMAIDAAGLAYVTGTTLSTDFPTFTGAFDRTLEGIQDAFVAKFNPNESGATSLIYTTYLGGNFNDSGIDIAVDAFGSAYVTGNTNSTNFPTIMAFDSTHNGLRDAFITKLNQTGSALVYSTYLGGSQTNDDVFDLSVVAGNAYVIGTTGSTDFPTTGLAFDRTFNGGVNDAYMTKLSLSGSDIAYSTYFGGSDSDRGSGIAVDAVGNAYITGNTASVGFPVTPGVYQSALSNSAGRPDAYISKFDLTGLLVYSTFFGGSEDEIGRKIAIDANGFAYIGGFGIDTVPTTPGAFDTTTNGSNDSFVTKLNQTGSGLVYSTYLGGSGTDDIRGIEVDAAGNAYIVGFTSSTNFPVADPLPTGSMNRGGSDAFITKLNPAGSALVYSTYLGGNLNDDAIGIKVDTAGNAYISGTAPSTNFPTTFTAYQQALSGGTSSDAFFTKIGNAPIIAATRAFDFDGDGSADLGVFRPSDRTWYLGQSTAGFFARQWGLTGDRLAPADYDGDGKADIAIWRDEPGDPDRARFYILQSSTGTARLEQFGRTGDEPSLVGDWDGDGKADPAVYRGGAQSQFYYRPSGQPSVGFIAIAWGTAGDRPMRGDFDGDGTLDAAIYRPSDSRWYIRQSTDLQTRYEFWGLSSDRFVPADYDGDGKTDLATWRNGVWQILQSASAQQLYLQWGVASDRLAPADYDGDGKTDLTVYRYGTWYIRRSLDGGFQTVNFGLAADDPIPSAYYP